MAGTPYLVDSNVLLRWVKPDDRDYPLIVSAIDAILQRGAMLCYTSQNVAEFWNTCTRPLNRNGYGLIPPKPTVAPDCLKTICGCCRIVWPCTRNGADCSLCTMSPVPRFTMRDWWPPCAYMASNGF
jgi:hypothetical protein